MMNSMNVPSKISTLEKKLDKVILALFCLLFCICLIGAIGSAVCVSYDYYYLDLKDKNPGELDQFNPDQRLKFLVNPALTHFAVFKLVVAQACMSIADIIKDLGYLTVEPYMPRLVEATLLLLRENSACQVAESDSEIDDDYAEHDEVLMDAVYVDALMPLALKELESPDATNRRNAAFCVGELCKNGGVSALKYYGDVYVAFTHCLGSLSQMMQ